MLLRSYSENRNKKFQILGGGLLPSLNLLGWANVNRTVLKVEAVLIFQERVLSKMYPHFFVAKMLSPHLSSTHIDYFWASRVQSYIIKISQLYFKWYLYIYIISNSDLMQDNYEGGGNLIDWIIKSTNVLAVVFFLIISTFNCFFLSQAFSLRKSLDNLVTSHNK